MALADLGAGTKAVKPAKHAAHDHAAPDAGEEQNHPESGEDQDHPDAGEPGRLTRWVRRDPIRAAAALLIIAQLAWRLDTTLRGYLAVDDFALVARAAESTVNGHYLAYIFNDHLMPGGLLLTWLVNKAAGLTYWPYAVVLIAGQAIVDVCFYRLARRLFAPGWRVLIPIAVLLFTPLTLEVTSMWTTGIMLLPMQIAMILAIGAQAKYARTRRLRHLAAVVGATLLGLAFFEKSLLILPLLFVLTACLFVSGGPIRSVWRTIVRFWPAWVAFIAVGVGYLALYQSVATSSLQRPASSTEVFGFVRQMVGYTLIPGLLGGPRLWLDIGDATPLVVAEEVPRWLAWAAFLLVVGATIRLRAVAGRAWTMFAIYVALIVALLAATRLGAPFSVLAGYAPRYVSDAVVVAAVSLGVALLGLAQPIVATHPTRRPLNLPAFLRDPSAAVIGLVVLLAAVSVVGLRTATSTARFSDVWEGKQGRDYLSTVAAEMAKAPKGTVFLERSVPEGVLHPLFFPYTEQSRFFNQIKPRPVFVTEAEAPSVFDDTGHIRPATVDGISLTPPLDQGCGYQAAHGTMTRLPLAGPVFDWTWTVRLGYLSSGESVATIRLGNSSHQFQVHHGLNQIFIVMRGSGSSLELQILDPSIVVCTKDVVVGNAVPQH